MEMNKYTVIDNIDERDMMIFENEILSFNEFRFTSLVLIKFSELFKISYITEKYNLDYEMMSNITKVLVKLYNRIVVDFKDSTMDLESIYVEYQLIGSLYDDIFVYNEKIMEFLDIMTEKDIRAAVIFLETNTRIEKLI